MEGGDVEYDMVQSIATDDTAPIIVNPEEFDTSASLPLVEPPVVQEPISIEQALEIDASIEINEDSAKNE